MKLRQGDPWMSADEYGRSLRGLTVNLLVRDVERSLAFAREVLGVEVVYRDPDFAVLRHGPSEWMLHADHTYRDHPLYGSLAAGDARGIGAEIRVHDTDPDAAEAAARLRGDPVLAGSMDKPHGVREVFILDPDGYLWAVDRPLDPSSLDAFEVGRRGRAGAMRLARVDRSTTPSTIELPREYNAAVEFIDANLSKGRGRKTAFIDAAGRHTYRELAERVNRAGNALRALGAGMETRVLMCMLDGIDFPAVFWGAIKAGCVPIPVNTLLTSDDYAHLLRDSRARVAVVSEELLDRFEPVLADQPHIERFVVAGGEAPASMRPAAGADSGAPPAAPARAGSGVPSRHRLADLLAAASPRLEPAPTTSDDIAFWLYTSGSTGTPKGSMHLHRDLITTAEHYGVGTLGIREEDVVYSAAKLFFAYGLGNGMTFPFYVGATAVVLAGRPTPDAVMAILREHRPTIFYGVPTLYGAMLALPAGATGDGASRLRLAVSAGEALPAEIGAAWEERFGAPILDGLGSTEMLHIFLSNRRGDVRYGTSGTAVPGYRLKLVAETGEPAAPGEIGELWVSGDSSAVAYWNQREKSLDTFHGPWTRTGDKYVVDEEGRYHYCGRTDDMLKVGGQWVSPFEVESALLGHEAVLEAAVVGAEDEQGLVKPKAFVVPREGVETDAALAAALKEFVKDRLAPFKYPRWIEFAGDLPKTATGKIQRFKLRR